LNLFGKPLSDYVRFSRRLLVLIAVAGLVGLALSLGGVPNSTVKWFSMTGLMWISVGYYAIRVHKTGFGTYKHLLPVLAVLNVVFQAIAIAGILIAILHRQRERIQRAGVRLRGRRQDVVSSACPCIHRDYPRHAIPVGDRVRNPGGNS